MVKVEGGGHTADTGGADAVNLTPPPGPLAKILLGMVRHR